MPVPPEAYARVFEQHHEGVAILAELTARFYDRPIHIAGGIEAQRESDHRASQRDVVHFILNKIGQVGLQEPDEPT